MTSPNNIIGLREQGKRLDRWEASVEGDIALKQNELGVVQKLKAANTEALEVLKEAARKTGRSEITLDDIKRCDTQREVLRFVAEVNFGLAHLGEVAELVVDARMSKADKDSVRSTLHHYANDAEDFVHIGKSWVFLTEFGPVPTLEEVECAEAPDQEMDGDATDEGDETGLAPGGEPVPTPVFQREMAVGRPVACSVHEGR